MYAEHSGVSPKALPNKWLELNPEAAAFRLLDGGDSFLDVGCDEGRPCIFGSVLFGWMSHIHAVPPITTSNQLLYG